MKAPGAPSVGGSGTGDGGAAGSVLGGGGGGNDGGVGPAFGLAFAFLFVSACQGLGRLYAVLGTFPLEE